MATCSECTFLNLEKEYESYDCKYWCEKWNEWKYADEAECFGYCHAYGRSDSVSSSYRKRSQESRNSSSGCFITTIVCNILKKEDNNTDLNKLRDFRNNVLQKDKKYLGLLITYDIVGPMISKELYEDPNRVQIATNLYNLGIKKVVDYLDINDYHKAIDLYINMTQLLIDGYNITKPTIDKNIAKNVPINQLGHGKQYTIGGKYAK